MKRLLILPTFFLPLSALAAADGLKGLIVSSGTIISLLIKLSAGLALLAFFWGLVQFVYKADPSEHEEGRNRMVWGVISLFVIFSIWGLVQFVGTAFHIDAGGSVGSGVFTPPSGPSGNQ